MRRLHMTLLSRSPGGALVFGFLGVATAAWPGPAAGTPPQRAPPQVRAPRRPVSEAWPEDSYAIFSSNTEPTAQQEL